MVLYKISYRNTGNSDSQNNPDKIFSNAGDTNDLFNDCQQVIVKKIIYISCVIKDLVRIILTIAVSSISVAHFIKNYV